MSNWLKRLFGKPEQTLPPVNEHVLSLEQEAQGLQLELAERDQLVANLKQELERQRSGANVQVTEAVQVQVERVLADVAAPVSQLLTQAHLLEVESKPVQARDVLVVAKRLVRSLEDHGLTLTGEVGQRVAFNPDHHEPLGPEVGLSPGQLVVVRFVGVAYHGKLLRKAGVTAAET